MARVLVVYATRTNSTREIAELVAEGIRFSGNEAVVVDVKEIKSAADLEGYDGYAFGCPTYHRDITRCLRRLSFDQSMDGLILRVGGPGMIKIHQLLLLFPG